VAKLADPTISTPSPPSPKRGQTGLKQAKRRRISVVDKRLRLAVALAWGTLLVMSLYDYDGRWRLLPFGIAIVGGVIAVTESRLRCNADESTTLKLSGR